MSSFSYSRYGSSQRRRAAAAPCSRRTALGYWIPLAISVTVATVAVAGWVWSERRDASIKGDDVTYQDQRSSSRRRKDSSPRHRRDISSEREEDHDEREDKKTISGDTRKEEEDEEQDTKDIIAGEQIDAQTSGLVARMSDVIRRTPSPQQFFTAASRSVTAAAGAVMGGRGNKVAGVIDTSVGEELGSVEREGWAEEAERRETSDVADTEGFVASQRTLESKPAKRQSRSRRKVVVIVVDSAPSARGNQRDEHGTEEENTNNADQASILSSLPRTLDHDSAQLLILIHAPHLIAHPLPATRSDDCSNFNPLYDRLYSIASSIVTHPTHVLPFTSSMGHIHLLRHIGPSLVYMEASLSGEKASGEYLKAVEGWVGQLVVVAGPMALEERRTCLGKGVELIDVSSVEENWMRRVANS